MCVHTIRIHISRAWLRNRAMGNRSRHAQRWPAGCHDTLIGNRSRHAQRWPAGCHDTLMGNRSRHAQRWPAGCHDTLIGNRSRLAVREVQSLIGFAFRVPRLPIWQHASICTNSGFLLSCSHKYTHLQQVHTTALS
jgi:hypothetical protein